MNSSCPCEWLCVSALSGRRERDQMGNEMNFHLVGRNNGIRASGRRRYRERRATNRIQSIPLRNGDRQNRTSRSNGHGRHGQSSTSRHCGKPSNHKRWIALRKICLRNLEKNKTNKKANINWWCHSILIISLFIYICRLFSYIIYYIMGECRTGWKGIRRCPQSARIAESSRTRHTQPRLQVDDHSVCQNKGTRRK